ncbi:hypothetical protein A2U01_0107689, partial [Trifolium medium]|nr:hypothetical protein [Trifolium medium]
VLGVGGSWNVCYLRAGIV